MQVPSQALLQIPVDVSSSIPTSWTMYSKSSSMSMSSSVEDKSSKAGDTMEDVCLIHIVD